MFSIAVAAHRAARLRPFLLTSTILVSLGPLCSSPALSQQSASPDLSLPEVVVARPVVRPRAPAPAPRSSSAPPRTQLPPAEAAPEANAQVVYSPTAVATPARDIASSVTVITAADIEREQRRTVPDALANVPGLNIVQTGGPRGQTPGFMRGAHPKQNKGLIAGAVVHET